MDVINEDGVDRKQEDFVEANTTPFKYAVPTELSEQPPPKKINIKENDNQISISNNSSFAVEDFCADTLSRSISELNISLPSSLGRSYESELPFYIPPEDSDTYESSCIYISCSLFSIFSLVFLFYYNYIYFWLIVSTAYIYISTSISNYELCIYLSFFKFFFFFFCVVLLFCNFQERVMK